MPTLATNTQETSVSQNQPLGENDVFVAPEERETINIDDLPDAEIANLIEGKIKDEYLADFKFFQEIDGKYDLSLNGQEKIVVFKRGADGRFFEYIYLIDDDDHYQFVNPPVLNQVFPVQRIITFYE